MKTDNILSIKDTTIIKAIAILIVISHNFLHWISPMPGENEFSFNPEYSQNFILGIYNDSLDSIRYLLTYIGPYALQLFIFISGYGLTIVYANLDIAYKKFIKKRISKIYPVFTIALVALFIYNYVIFRMELNSDVAVDFILRYSLIANLIPGKVFILNGPFWFYSMIVQLYLLFPILLYFQRRNSSFLWILVSFIFLIIFSFNSYLSSVKFSLYYNFIGNLPVFIFGMLYAFYGKKINDRLRWLIPISIIILILSLYNKYFWYLSYISFLIVFIGLFTYFKKYSVPNWVAKFIMFTGGLSYYLFAVHGFLRKPWIGWANKMESNTMNYLYLVLFLIASYIAAITVKRIEKLYLSYKKKKIS